MKLRSFKAKFVPFGSPEASGQSAPEGSASHIVLLLTGARLFFLVIGLVFLLGEVLDILVNGDNVTSRIVVRIAVLSIMAPAIVWVSTRWAEKVLREAFESQNRLIEAGIVRAAQGFQSEKTDGLQTKESPASALNEHAVLAQMGRIVTSSLDIEDIYDQFSREIRNVLGFDMLVICTADESKAMLRREFISGTAAKYMEGRGHLVSMEGTISTEAIARRATIITQGMGRQELSQRFPGMEPLFEDGMRSFITSPLFSKDRAVGILGVASQKPMAYTERDREFVESAAQQIGGALANSQLHGLLQAEARDKELLAEIGRVVSSSPRLDEVFDRVSNLIGELIPAERVSVTLTSDDGRHSRLAFVSGRDVAEQIVNQSSPMAGSLTERVIQSRRGEIIQDMTEDDLAAELLGLLPSFKTGLRSVLGVPLFSNDVVIGCLQLRSTAEGAFDSDHLALAERIADQVAGAIANSELNRALEREIAEKSALAEIGRTMSMSLDMEEVYERFGEIVQALAPSDRFLVNLLAADGQSLEIAYRSGESMEEREIGSRFPVEGSFGGHAVKNKSTIVLDSSSDSSEAEAWLYLKPATRARYKSFLASPLIVNDEVVGVLQFRSRAPNAYGESVVRVVENIASHVAGFIANARLHAEVQAEAKERTILAEIGRVISSSPDVHNIYERFADLVKDIIPSDQLSIGFLDHERNATKLAYVTGVEVPSVGENSMIGLAGSLNDKVMSERRGLIVQDRSMAELEEEYPRMVAGYRVGLRSAIGVPLVANDQVIGCMQFRSLSERAYTGKHLNLAERISDQISGAIANSELRSTLEHEVTKRAALAEIGKTMTLSLDLEDVYERFAELVQPLASADRITISLLTDDEDSVYIAYSSGGKVPGRNQGDRISIDGTIAGEAIRNNKAIVLHPKDASELEGHLDRLIPSFKAGYRSFIAVPLIVQGRVIGALHLRSNTENAYDKATADMAESISAQVAGAIANARLHSSVQKESERRAALAEIGRIISSTLELDAVYDAFADAVNKLIPFDRISITVLDQPGGVLSETFVRGLDVPNRRPGDMTDMEGSTTEAVVSSRSTILLQPHDDGLDELISSYPRLQPIIASGIKSFLSVPLIARDSVVGVLNFNSTSVTAFTSEHVTLAENVAGQISGAISSAQLHAQVTASQLALSRSEWRYRHMVESASDIVCTLDDEGYFTYINQPITKYTGYTEEDLLGRHFTEIVSPDWKNRVLRTCIIDTRAFGKECVMEFPVATRSSGVCWLEQTMAPMFDDGKIVGFQGIARDITARKEIESERESLITELREALSKIKTLSGLLPICASCKKVRDDNGYWNQIETYISAHSDADFSHSICPSCVKELYPQLNAATRGDA